MEIWFMDLYEEKRGPHKVVAQDKDNYFIHHPNSNWALQAIPKCFVITKIEFENELIIDVEKYVLSDKSIKVIDFKYADFAKVEH